MIEDFGLSTSSLILQNRPVSFLYQYLDIVSIGTIGISTYLASKQSPKFAAFVFVFLGFIYWNLRLHKLENETDSVTEDSKMMLRVLIKRYGNVAYYLYRNTEILRAYFQATMYINEHIEHCLEESIHAAGKLMYYVIFLEKGYYGDTRELIYELNLLHTETLSSLMQHEFVANPSSVMEDDKTILFLTGKLKPLLKNVLEHCRKLIHEIELRRINKVGVNKESNLTALGPWYSYKPDDIVEENELYI